MSLPHAYDSHTVVCVLCGRGKSMEDVSQSKAIQILSFQTSRLILTVVYESLEAGTDTKENLKMKAPIEVRLRPRD